jgi:hypothetical protein
MQSAIHDARAKSAILVFFQEVWDAWHYLWGQFLPSLVITAPAAPIVAAVLTIALIGASTRTPAVDVMTAAAVNLFGAWASIAGLHWTLGLGTVQQANSSSYHNLRIRLDEIEARHDMYADDDRLNTADSSNSCTASAQAAHAEMHRHLKAIKRELARASADWVNGYGYVNTWRQIHRLEESWLCIAKPEEIHAEAERARAALSGSKMRDTKQLLDQLATLHNSLHLDADQRTTGVAKSNKHRDAAALVAARWCVRSVWRTIHKYRDSRWNGMVQARNRLMLSMGLSGLLIYGLLWLSIIGGAPAKTIYAVTAIYLAAATVGLFNRLHAASATAVVIDDYDLAIARLTVTPQLSGMAAVLGVTLAAVASQSTFHPIELSAAFSEPAMIALALAFGLTPGLLIDRLKQWHDRTADEVQSTYPGSGARSEDAPRS